MPRTGIATRALLLLAAIPSCATVDERANVGVAQFNRQKVAESDSPFRLRDAPQQATAPPVSEAGVVRQVSHAEEPEDSSQVVPPGPAPDADSPAEPSAALSAAGAVSVEQLEGLALSNNPTLRQLSASVAKGRGLRRQVGLYPNPSVGYTANEIGAEGEAGQQGAFLSQTVVTGDKLDLNRNVADWEIQSLLWELETQRLRVANAVRSQFYRTLGAERRVAVARRLVTVAEAGAAASEELLGAGQAARPDVLQAQIQLNEVRVALRNAEAEYDASWSQLAAVTGCPELPPAPLAGSLDVETQARDLDTLHAQLLAASPELQAARARVSRARAQIRRQEVQPTPNLEVQVGGAHDFSSGDPIANVQFGVPVPLFNRNQGNIDIARAECQRAVADLRRRELDLRSRAASALRDYRQAASQVRTYRDEILPAAEENLELTEAGYERGEFDLLRALTARRSFFEANLALISSQVSLREADVTISGLLLAEGGLNDVPDSEAGSLVDPGLREQAISGE